MATVLRVHLTVIRDITVQQEWLEQGEGSPPKTTHEFVQEYKKSVIEDPLLFVDSADATLSVEIETDERG